MAPLEAGIHTRAPNPTSAGWTALALLPRDLLALVILALCARLTFLWAALQTHDLKAVAMLAPDSSIYLQLAESLRAGLAMDPHFVLLAGPGYPALLAGLAKVFGASLWPPVIMNILLGSLAPVAVYLLASALLQDRTVALVSGLIVALSFTGLSMSTSLLTDQPFYTLHAFSLVCFLRGLRSGRRRWFLAAGLIAAVATAIRSVGQLWPYLYAALACLWVLVSLPPRTWNLLARSLWTPAVMLTVVLGWSAVNQARDGLFVFTTNGVHASWAYLVAMSVADHTPGGNIDSVRQAWSDDVLRLQDGRSPSSAEIYQRMKSQVLAVAREHPLWLAESFSTVVWRNARESNYYAETQIPQWQVFWRSLRGLCHDWINPLVLLLSLASLVLLLHGREWHALFVLGLTYAYFTLTAGFSFWQGSRLHYPAEMVGSILVSYLVVATWRRMRKGRPAATPPAELGVSGRPV